MKFFPLLWSSLWRKKFRTVFTLLSIFVAFLLFGLLMTIRTAFSFGVEIAGIDRLVLIHKVSLIMPLPISYQERLRATEGVTLVTHNSWFGGVYQDPSNFFAQIVVDPEPFMTAVPGIQAAARSIQGLAGRPAGRDRRRRPGAPLQLEDRRSRSDPGNDLAAEAGPGLGVQHRRHLRRRGRRGQDAVLLPLRLPQREPPGR